jgi:hypothetical protein
VPGLVLDDGRAVFLALGCLALLDLTDDIDDLVAFLGQVFQQWIAVALRLRLWCREAERLPCR